MALIPPPKLKELEFKVLVYEQRNNAIELERLLNENWHIDQITNMTGGNFGMQYSQIVYILKRVKP